MHSKKQVIYKNHELSKNFPGTILMLFMSLTTIVFALLPGIYTYLSYTENVEATIIGVETVEFSDSIRDYFVCEYEYKEQKYESKVPIDVFSKTIREDPPKIISVYVNFKEPEKIHPRRISDAFYFWGGISLLILALTPFTYKKEKKNGPADLSVVFDNISAD